MDRPRENRLVKTSHLSIAFTSSFLLTIFFLQWWQEASYPMTVWIPLGFLGFFGFLGFLKTAMHAAGMMLIASTLAISLAFFSVARTTHVATASTVDWYAQNETLALRGSVAEQPDDRGTAINYVIAVSKLQKRDSAEAVPVSGRVLVSDKRTWPRFQYGDDVMAEGNLDTPKATDVFAYDSYLSRFDIYSVLQSTNITLIRGNVGNPLMRMLSALRTAFEARIKRIEPEPHASFLAGLLTGAQHGMPADLLQTFRNVGLTHIVAISGFNITIIVSVIGSLLFFLPLRWRFVPSIVGIILFTLLVGSGASVVRASIMGILGLFALQAGRVRDIRLAILWAAFAMLLWNPKVMWYDIGFQLSFLAVIGLTESKPLLDRAMDHIPYLPYFPSLREPLQMTLAAQVFAMPWVVARFGMLSLVSPIANMLVECFIPPAMLVGFVATMLSFVSLPLGRLIGFAAFGLLQVIMFIAQSLAKIPYASIATPNIGIAIISIYYILLIAAIVWMKKSTDRQTPSPPPKIP